MDAEILRGKPYLCSALKLEKNKGVVGDGKFDYDFDIKK